MKRNLPRSTRGVAPARFRGNDEEAGPSTPPTPPSAGPGRPSTSTSPSPASTSPRPGPGPCLAPPGTPPGLATPARPALLPFSPARAMGGRRRTTGMRQRQGIPADLPDLAASDHSDDDSSDDEEEDFGADEVRVGGDGDGEQSESDEPAGQVREPQGPVQIVPGNAGQDVGAAAEGQQNRPPPPVQAHQDDHAAAGGQQGRPPVQADQEGGAAAGGQHPRIPPPLQRQAREVAGAFGEQVLLQDILDPDIPGPHPGPVLQDTDGFNMIDKWGVWQCALCEFPTLLDIPRCYRDVWARAVDRVLTTIQEAEGGLELERGLKWLLILPKALFRQGRRGGKAGKGLISQRINTLIRGDWGSLLTMLERDCKLVAREDRTRVRQREGGIERKRKNALLLLAKGQISKAVRTITSNGIGDMDDPVVREQMESKYPDRVHTLPESVTKGQCVDNLRGLKDLLLTLEGGVSAGNPQNRRQLPASGLQPMPR
jgi:hypothetical protein